MTIKIIYISSNAFSTNSTFTFGIIIFKFFFFSAISDWNAEKAKAETTPKIVQKIIKNHLVDKEKMWYNESNNVA